MTARLVVVCGLPGAGKTTFARRRAEELCALRLCPDEWMGALGVDLFDQSMRGRVERLQWEIAQRLLTVGTSVVIEWGTWTRAERDALHDGARALGAAVELHYLNESFDVLWQRVQRRNQEPMWGARPITREDMESYVPLFEPPTAEELSRYDEP